MSSDLKVTNIKHESSSSNNLVLASDGTTTVSGALTASGGIANAGTITAGTIGTGVTINAGTNVSGIGQLVGMSIGGNTGGDDGSDVTIDVNKNYLCWVFAWHATASLVHMETWTATGNGTSHSFSEELAMNSGIGVAVGSGGNGTVRFIFSSDWSYGQMMVIEQGSTFDIT